MDIFDLSSDMGHVFEFRNTIPSNYKGIILPHGAIYSLHGGFGDFVFQQIVRPYFDLWYSNYLSRQRFKTHARADVPLIELTILFEHSASYCLAPGRPKVHQRSGQFNIFNTLAMDNKVQFDKSARYTTLDIHAKKVLLDRLYTLYPALWEPLMNAIAAGREYMFFQKPLYLTPEMEALVDYILVLLRAPILDVALLEMTVITLFAHAIACKLETMSKGISNSIRQDQEAQLRDLRNVLLTNNPFRNTAHYARMVGMSRSALTRTFKNLNGIALKQFWRNNRMEEARYDVLHTDKSLDDIAVEHGYADGASFSRVFNKTYSFPPSFFRQHKK